jgi:hypothetical protein
MSSKKDVAVDALMNLHFADRAGAEQLLEKLFDAFEEIHEERMAAPPSEDIAVDDLEPVEPSAHPEVAEPPPPEPSPAETPPAPPAGS